MSTDGAAETARDILRARAVVVALIGFLEVNDAAEMLRGVASELDPSGIHDCSGRFAVWCQVHGECTCPRPSQALDSPLCVLHGPGAEHPPLIEGKP